MYLNNIKTRRVKYFSFLIILLTGFLGKFTYAAIDKTCNNNCQIPVEFKGEYLDSTCVVSVNGGGPNGTVKLPTIGVKALERKGAEHGNTRFSIGLKNCPAPSNIHLYMTNNAGNGDAVTGNLKNTTGGGYAKGVQVRVRKEDGNQMFIDDINTHQKYVIPAINTEVTHYYEARYYAEDNGSASAGLVVTKALIELDYK